MSRYPWRDTSEDIAEGSSSQWETPQGAQEKADKAEQDAKEYADTLVESFGDLATTTTKGLMSSADKAKIDTVATGADVSPNSFGKVNTVNATQKMDTLNVVGGVGIVVSNNPSTKTMTITATSEAIPGAHGSSHEPGGADPIPELERIVPLVDGAQLHALTENDGSLIVPTVTSIDNLTTAGFYSISSTFTGNPVLEDGVCKVYVDDENNIIYQEFHFSDSGKHMYRKKESEVWTVFSTLANKQYVDAQLTTHAENVSHVYWLGTAGGTANALTATLTGMTLVAGLGVSLKANADSTAAVTLNINDDGAIPIKKANGNAVTNLKAGGVYTLRYDGASAFILQGEGGEYGDATAEDVISGKTFSGEDGLITGTLALTGNATAAHVLAGKTFYSNNAKTKLTGTMVAGKKYASGTAVSSATGLTFTTTSDDGITSRYITVSGLNFTASVINILDNSKNNYVSIYNSDINPPHTYNFDMTYKFKITGNAYVNSTGFQLPVLSPSTSYFWTAHE